MIRPISCRICGGPAGHWYTTASRPTFRCAACGHIEVPAGLARLADGRSIYEAEDAVFVKDGNADYYLDDTNAQAGRRKAAFVRRYCRAGTLIDVGASYGHFLAAIGKDFDAQGFEVSPDAVAYAVRQFGVRNLVGSVYEWPASMAEPVDVITSWDVIEHLEDPVGAIQIMRAHLKPGGLLFLSTPDAGSLVARLMGTRWHYLDPVQHINLFSRANLIRVLKDENFTIEGARSIGRDYRVSYVLNHLQYLYRGRWPAAIAGVVQRVAGPVAGRQIPIKLGDVMGVVARRPRD